MNILIAEIQMIKAIGAVVSDDALTVELADGRTLSIPWPGTHACCTVRQPNVISGNGLVTAKASIGLI